jgi:hypothetical protein
MIALLDVGVGQDAPGSDNVNGVQPPETNNIEESRAMGRPKKGSVNKSEEIRQLLSKLGADASPTEVAKLLAEKGIQVHPNMVSGIKIKMRKAQGTSAPRQQTSRAQTRNGSIAEKITAIRRLADEVGGMAELKQIVIAMHTD